MEALARRYQETPAVQVVDHRGLLVREIQYNRLPVDDPVAGDQVREREIVITAHVYNILGQRIRSMDPRCVEQQQQDPMTVPTWQQVTTVSGQCLWQAHVDSGRQYQLADARGNPQWSCDAKGQEREWEYDELGRLTAVFESGAEGQQGLRTPRRCCERLYYGDHVSTLVLQSIADINIADANIKGQLVQHDDEMGSRQMAAYDHQGQPLSETLQFLVDTHRPVDWPAGEESSRGVSGVLEDTGYTTLWQYTALGELSQQVDAKGHTQRFQTDLLGQIQHTSVVLDGEREQPLLTACHYNAEGQLLKARLDNGITLTRRYDPFNLRLIAIHAIRHRDHKVLQELHYRYDPVGNVTAIDDASQEIDYHANQAIKPENRYDYDALYQLIAATGREQAHNTRQSQELPLVGIAGNPDTTQLRPYRRSYTYDKAGNLLNIRHQGQGNYSLTLQVDTQSHRAVPIEPAMDTLTGKQLQASFDANGNPLWLNSGKHPLAWDSYNQLKGFTLLARANHRDDTEYYGYDAGGQRRQKTYTQQAHYQQHLQRVRYLPGLELREAWQQDLDGQNQQRGEHCQLLTLNAGPVTVRVFHWESGKPDKIAVNDTRHYALTNHLGSNQLQVDGQAEVVSYEEYYPYGGTAITFCRNQVEADDHVVRYSGKERDRSGLYYYGARYYAPWLGRWLNPDPAGTIDGLNLFRMVHNNPIRFLDSDGSVPRGFQSIPNKSVHSSLSALPSDYIKRPLGKIELYKQDLGDFTLYQSSANAKHKNLLIFSHGSYYTDQKALSVVPPGVNVHFYGEDKQILSTSMGVTLLSNPIETLTPGSQITDYDLSHFEEPQTPLSAQFADCLESIALANDNELLSSLYIENSNLITKHRTLVAKLEGEADLSEEESMESISSEIEGCLTLESVLARVIDSAEKYRERGKYQSYDLLVVNEGYEAKLSAALKIAKGKNYTQVHANFCRSPISVLPRWLTWWKKPQISHVKASDLCSSREV